MVASFSLRDLLKATQATRLQPGLDFESATICTDTRQLGSSQVFLPIVGEHFDGHAFLAQIVEHNILGSFVQADRQSTIPPGLQNILLVPDTVLAYLALGRFHRRRVNPTVIGITGSSGKTTTKELFFFAFSQLSHCQCTQKNFNNDFGVSQTLLELEASTELAIVEMAMRGSGEISRLTQAAEPNIAVITNVGPAHIERLGSLQAIAKAKCEIVQGLNPINGVAVVNGDDDLLCQTLASVWKGNTIRFSLNQAEAIQPTSDGGVQFTTRGRQVTLSVPGKHMVRNALAVIAVAEFLGCDLSDIIAGLETYQPLAGRWKKHAIPGIVNGWSIQDAYNANPDSMRASLEAFFELPVTEQTQKALILGGMNELGAFSATYHQQLGEWLNAQSQLAWVLLIGEDNRITQQAMVNKNALIHWVPDVEAAKTWFWKHPSLANTLVLLKGSRGYQLELIVEA